MQLGRLEMINQASIDHVDKISRVENLDQKHKLVADDKYKNLMEQQNKIPENEVMLDNVKFGFDNETKQFFVRIETDNGEMKFPTEQIMKMKAYFLESLEKNNKE